MKLKYLLIPAGIGIATLIYYSSRPPGTTHINFAKNPSNIIQNNDDLMSLVLGAFFNR